MKFAEQFTAARYVSTPIIAIRTFDASSTIGAIKRILAGKLAETPLLLWDAAQGLQPLTTQSEQEAAVILGSNEQAATVQLTETLFMLSGCSADTIIFIANAHMQWKDNATVIQGIWNLRDSYKAQGSMLVLLCSPGAALPTELVNDVLVLDEPLPTVPELETIVLDAFKSSKVDAPDAETLARATDALTGLPAFAADQATAMCQQFTRDEKNKLHATLNLPELWERKRQIIGQTPGLSVWQGTERMEDIGGIEAAKEFFHAVMRGIDPPKVFIFMDEIEKALAGTGSDSSGVKTELTGSMLTWMNDTEMDGVILIGIPGVSKTNLAKAVGGTYNRPVINFDLAGMQSGIVGSSGERLRGAQKTVDAISGGRIFAIATCNSITALPPELRRRFAEGIFFFDAPTAPERAAIWDIYREKYNIPATDKTPADAGWTGAEIKQCCKKAYRLRMALVDAAKYIVPVTLSSADAIQALRTSCSGKYLSASKPGVYKSVETPTTVPVYPIEGGRKMRETMN